MLHVSCQVLEVFIEICFFCLSLCGIMTNVCFLWCKVEPNQEFQGLVCEGANVLPAKFLEDAFRSGYGRFSSISLYLALQPSCIWHTVQACVQIFCSVSLTLSECSHGRPLVFFVFCCQAVQEKWLTLGVWMK